jgi:hypothetical protein
LIYNPVTRHDDELIILIIAVNIKNVATHTSYAQADDSRQAVHNITIVTKPAFRRMMMT